MSEDTLRKSIQESTVAAMRAQDKDRLGVMRLIQAAIKRHEIDGRANGQELSLGDEQVLILLDKMVKQRRESIEQFTTAGRTDLSDKESFEIGIIQEFLPEPLTPEELQSLVQETVAAVGATSMRDMGKVMGMLKPKIQGRADGNQVAALIKAQLNS